MIHKKNGFTIVELLVAMALSGIVMIAVYKSFASQQKTYSVQDDVAAMQQDLRAAMDIMVREIRMAGYSPSGATAGIVAATDVSLQFTSDLNENGVLTNVGNPNEQITYALTGTGSLGRESWGGGLQPMAENIDALNFVYLNANGDVIDPATELANIRSIQITIVAKSDRWVKEYNDLREYCNQQGTVVLRSPVDGFRRRLLTTTIRCRNLGVFK